MSSERSKNSKEQYEHEFYRFLRSRILKFGGTIELQHITGHLSQVRPEVRNAIGSSKVDIANFLEKYQDTFVISNNVVSVISKSKKMDYDSDASSVDTEASLPNKIKDGKGVIVKLMPNYGFLKITDPVKSSAYFQSKHFGFDNKVDLTDCKLYIGTVVYLNAVKEPPNKRTSSKYRATKVWKYDKEEGEVIHYSKKTQDTGIFDPINLEGDGTIQNVFPTFGFILVAKDNKTTVYFKKDKVANFENIVDLTKIFEPGDMVEFTAHRTVKKDAKARYQAIQVWKKSAVKTSSSSKTASSKSNSSTVSSNISKSNFIKPGAFLELPGFYSKSSPTKKVVEPKNSSREMIYDQPGKICPRGNNAVIKFGENFSQLADGDSSMYYVCGTQVTEISWEFNDGDAVNFDAVKIKSAPGWKALLVWTGKKPDVLLAPHLGDFSEYTDDETDEILDDNHSSISEKQMSLSSHSSLNSISMKSESSDLKTNKSCKESSEPDDSDSNAENRNASNICFKQRNLCDSPSVYNTQNGRNSAKDPQHLDLKSESHIHADFSVTGENECSSIESKMFENSESLKGATSISNLSKNPSFDNLNGCLRESKSTTSLSSYTSKDSEKSKHFQTKLSKSVLQGRRKSKDFKSSKKSNEFQNKLKHNTSLNSDTSDDPETLNKSKEFEIKSTKVGQDVHNEYVSEKFNSNTYSSDSSSEETDKNFGTIKTTGSTERDETKENETKIIASITKYDDIPGKITKAYATFAEVVSSELPNPVAFFWSIFYSGKASMEELDINDLRQVLNVGDCIKFNIFMIVDDLGQSWQKISLAWIGDKPLKCYEMSPYEFIQQNNLSVSIENVSQYTKAKKADEIPVKKFLVACEDDDDLDDEINPSDETTLILRDDLTVSKTEHCSSEESDAYHSPEPFLPSEGQIEDSTLELQNFSDMICQKLLKNKDFFVNSKIDLDSLSSEVVNLVLQKYRSEQASQIPILNDSTHEKSKICSCYKKTFKITEVQTICTGEIMSQNIFTEC